ncbi:TRAP transporter substrate-binding protein [Neolewinella antarctica]|uniref:TRAP-type mannitol/chloroaromatic compound transport system substrate-binding protein n=1 Tax=Neolewinella antarctica TaxID=442734 RepID=A0ABX0XAT4_9BACT|nr:ABC transporter substrate-binding protein [Neolewinella antarctica]NJC25938.1 TRAP-type mannitol/chloroaromatic compound transport system substrate-binding protein [Neolewinella antarctica]
MKRNEFLKKGLLGAAGIVGATALVGCADDTEQVGAGAGAKQAFKQTFDWRMTTVWGKNFPVFGEAANLLSEWVDTMSGGRFKIKVFGSGELVPGLESFDTTAAGTTEMGAGASYYWQGKTPAAAFFAAVPFGMNGQQLQSWLIGGDAEGYELWKEVYAPFNLVPFLAGNTGVQMGGWFNKEINSVADLQGLKMRIPGLAGKALEKAGGASINVAPGELYTNLERGVIDATEWVGPYHDYKLGLNKVAKYYYTPGWHEPGTQLEFFANKDAHDKLPADLKEILYTATLRVQAWVLAEFDARNGEYLAKMKAEGTVMKEFPDAVLSALRGYTEEAITELIGSDPVANKVYASYNAFRTKAKAWSAITERAYYDKIEK